MNTRVLLLNVFLTQGISTRRQDLSKKSSCVFIVGLLDVNMNLNLRNLACFAIGEDIYEFNAKIADFITHWHIL